MRALDHCPDGGWLVNLGWWLPVDPHHAAWSSQLKIGCNRLMCRACGAEVRSGAFEPATEGARPTASDLYDAQDWSARDDLRPATKARLYVCRCRVELVYAARPCDPLHAPMPFAQEVPLPWTCQGHEAVVLPATLDGVSLPAALDALAGVVRAQLTARPPAAAAVPDGLAEQQPGLWVAQLVRRLADPAAKSAVLGAVRDCTADPVRREAALNALRWSPSPEGDGADELVDALRAAADGARERALGQAVEQRLLKIAAGKVVHAALVDAALDALARGVAVPELIFMLTEIDRGRVAIAARTLLSRSQAALEYVASALEDHPEVLGALFKEVVADGTIARDLLLGPDAQKRLSKGAAAIAQRALA